LREKSTFKEKKTDTGHITHLRLHTNWWSKLWSLQHSASTFYFSTEYCVALRVWKECYESCKWELLKDKAVVGRSGEELMSPSIPECPWGNESYEDGKNV
jgi:hypothetical protein